MRSRCLFAALCLGAAAATFAGPATADRVYHTERLQLSGVGGAPGGGMVVTFMPTAQRLRA